MIGTFLVAWLLFVALLVVVSLGLGLGLRVVSGGAMPGPLVLPVGLAAAVVVCSFVTNFHGAAPLAGPLVAVLAVVGLFAAARDRRQPVWAWIRRSFDRWSFLAASGAFAVIAAPVVLSGEPTFSGYARIVDIAYQFDLATHFAAAGRVAQVAPDSSFQLIIHEYLASGYPGGGQATMGSLSRLTPVDVAWLYQAYLAYVAAMLALSLYVLAGALIRPRPVRAIASFISAQPNILVGYALAGGIKELHTECFLVLSAALFVSSSRRAQPGRGQIAFPLALSAAFSSLELVIAPWLGVLLVGLFIASVYRARRRLTVIVGWAQIAVVFFAVSAPALAASFKLAPIAGGPGLVDLGNLAAPVPNWAAAGVWLTPDHRFPLSQAGYPTATYTVIGITLALALAGVAALIRGRRLSILSLGMAGLAAVVYVAVRYGPWIQLKAQCLSAPIALLFAFFGAWTLIESAGAGGRGTRHSGRFALAWLLGASSVALLAGAVLFGNALAYHSITLAPYARLHDLQQIDARFAGRGPTLYPDFDEYADYFLRDMRADTAANPPTFILQNTARIVPNSYDINKFDPAFVQTFRFIVRRRDPMAVRPPANFNLVWTTRYHEVWAKHAGLSVLAHFPQRALTAERTPAFCAALAARARSAGPGARFAYTFDPDLISSDATNQMHSPSMTPLGGQLIAHGPGRAHGAITIPVAGDFAIWEGGSIGRPVAFRVDGKPLATVGYQETYPGQYVLLGTRRLSAGVHHVSLFRGAGSLHPGSGDGVDALTRTVDPTVFLPLSPAPRQLLFAGIRGFGPICRSPRRMNWIEIVRS